MLLNPATCNHEDKAEPLVNANFRFGFCSQCGTMFVQPRRTVTPDPKAVAELDSLIPCEVGPEPLGKFWRILPGDYIRLQEGGYIKRLFLDPALYKPD